MAEKSLVDQTSPVDKKPLAEILHTGATAWVILGVSLAITLVAWQLATSFADKRAQDRFDFQVEEAQFAIQKRLTDYEQALRGGIGLFQASKQVSREEWRTYTRTLQIEKHYPGIQGIGFSRWIPPEQKDSIISAIRAEGFHNFDIKPPGVRDVYTSIVYLEPFDWRNQRAFGFDMFSEPTRRAAMMHARDTGETAMSGKVKLVQETARDVQNGFLMYLPLYQKGALLNSVAARRDALLGFVYSPFRIRDLMQGILGQGLPELNFEIYDGKHKSSDSLLYVSAGPTPALQSTPSFTTEKQLGFGGHTWTIRYASNPAFEAATRSTQPLIVAVGGVIIDLLLFYIIISLARLRKQALELARERQDKLLEREGQFRAITDSAHEGIVSMEAEGRITYVNPAAEHMFGLKNQDALGKNLLELIAPQFRPLVKEMLDAPQDTTTPLEVVGQFVNGTAFPLEISLSKWHVGRHAYASAILRDLTEPKRIERMKSEFISTVSHELRTPLTAIRGALGLAAGTDKGCEDDETQKLMRIANSHAERLSRLIDDILDFDTLQSGQMHFDLQPLPVRELVQQAVQAHADMATKAHIRLELASCCDALIYVDASRFQQVMVNLLNNAIKFSPHGETVRILVENQDGFIRISIINKGAGISEQFRSRIFQRFAQEDASDARAKGGAGLGLSIAKSIVESFGGRIDYESIPNIQTIFFFELPKYKRLALKPSAD